ncbi:hypothetical protein CHS0354_002941 [Potamilus streckersoni]|uniref:Hexosyltransferase n=1 Tax=Potamilus streckersoni TaxID=2493646 RepID=A0AAE0VI52_9BIVA|nr:hypothetical protein CHS0354_002941 [Potamilus streckersoni]
MLAFLCMVFVFLEICMLHKTTYEIDRTTSRDLLLHREHILISRDNTTTTILPAKDMSVIYIQENIERFTKLLITNGDICAEKQIDLIIYIQSHWINVERRRSLRETWTDDKLFTDVIIKYVFILGKPINRADQVKINNENLIHRDIVQGDFIETFQNITLKSIIALNWITKNCLQAKFVAKADDDVFVDVFKVVNTLLPSLKNKTRNIVCSVKENNTSPIVRDKGSKWYIPEYIFPKWTHLPRFCTGKDSHLLAAHANKDDYIQKMWMEVLFAQNKEKP